jgi:phosphoglycolate phosphatase-like HAD superfamily hydrolase
MAMPIIEGILFDPVGCLAEFTSEEFDAVAARVFGQRSVASKSGSQAYWDLLSLMDTSGRPLNVRDRAIVDDYEVQAASRARGYDDVMPALSELNDLGIRLILASSLSAIAVARFLERFSLDAVFADVWSRDTAGGVICAPLITALRTRSLTADRQMFITDTAQGLQAAQQVGINAILMMNDPDEAMKLTAHNPAGGIVSLHELPDFVRLVAAEHARPGA